MVVFYSLKKKSVSDYFFFAISGKLRDNKGFLNATVWEEKETYKVFFILWQLFLL